MIYLRSESYANEYRVALVPDDIAKLVSKGYTVVVESAPSTRIFPDSAYSSVGALVTTEKWYSYGFAQGLFAPGTGQFIIGLKQLEGLDKLCSHTHIYFSHSYKGQKESEEVLSAFFRGGSILYDLEYFRKPDGSRTLAFGKYAGMVGAALGLLQTYRRKSRLGDICNLKPWKSFEDMMGEVRGRNIDSKILIIGNGRCSNGVQTVLKDVGCDFDVVGREGVKNIYEYDSVFNCIALSVESTSVWMRKGDETLKDILVVDISCDYTKPNNPFAIYSEGTTAEKPVLHVSEHISVIAIDNLPSLLPSESSVEFSGLLTDLLLRYGDACWRDNLAVYKQQISQILPV
jgi:saccharopine dehydrogenase (NAD+, L-lysine-forming)